MTVRVGTQSGVSRSDKQQGGFSLIGFLSTLTLVGAMSEWFILNRYADVGISRLAPFGNAGAGEPGALARSTYESIATCIARSDPAAAFALIHVGDLIRSSADGNVSSLARFTINLCCRVRTRRIG